MNLDTAQQVAATNRQAVVCASRCFGFEDRDYEYIPTDDPEATILLWKQRPHCDTAYVHSDYRMIPGVIQETQEDRDRYLKKELSQLSIDELLKERERMKAQLSIIDEVAFTHLTTWQSKALNGYKTKAILQVRNEDESSLKLAADKVEAFIKLTKD